MTEAEWRATTDVVALIGFVMGNPTPHRKLESLDALFGVRRPNAEYADLSRCVVGNSFRPVAADPAWLTIAAVALAVQMSETRDFSPMPILADALQDAGCADEQVLAHCRGDGPHARGCWVVDLLTGRA